MITIERYALEVDRMLHLFAGRLKSPETIKIWDKQRNRVEDMTNEILNGL